jgi:hypothetical protein
MESCLCVIKECFVYRIPNRTQAKGYKASEWDVTQFLWTGRLRVLATGDEIALQLEDATTGDLFAKCPVDAEMKAVEPCIDSSRYFVIKVVDPNTKQNAFVGLGFQERSFAFDMNIALQDHFKRLRREEPKVDHGPVVDYSLKQGEKITISLSGMTKKSVPTEQEEIFALPPPPSQKKEPSWDDFSDFSSTTKGGWTSFE